MSWVNMLCINFSLCIFYKHSPSIAVSPQIQAWLSLSRRDMIWFGQKPGVHSLQQLTTCSSAAAREPSPGSRIRVLNSDGFYPIKSSTFLHYSQKIWALTTQNWTLLQVPNRPAPHLWDFKIQTESNNFLGCQVAPAQIILLAQQNPTVSFRAISKPLGWESESLCCSDNYRLNTARAVRSTRDLCAQTQPLQLQSGGAVQLSKLSLKLYTLELTRTVGLHLGMGTLFSSSVTCQASGSP